MSNILTIAFATEGKTDQRFLHSIIRKTFEELALSCPTSIEVYEPVHIKVVAREGFVSDIATISRQAFKIGINVLCVHVDADSNSPQNVLEHKINPSFENIHSLQEDNLCKNLVAIIPVHMSEAWMLADRQLLKEEVGTDMSNEDLELSRHPETIANPKGTIERMLEIAQKNLSKRRNKLTISELYQPIGQTLSMEKLEALSSYRSFKSSAEEALRKLNYLN